MTTSLLLSLIGVPLGASLAGAILPRAIAPVAGALAMLSVLASVVLAQPGTALQLGGADLALTQIGRLELGFVALLGLALLLFTTLSHRTASVPSLLAALVAAVAASAVFSTQLLVSASFVLLASLITSLAMIGEQPDWQASVAGAVYLVLSSLGGVALLFGFVLADLQRLSPGGLVTVPFVVATVSIGLALQWGAAPFHAWLPGAVERAGPASAVLAVGVMGPATLGLLFLALSAMPQLVADPRVDQYLMYGGLLTAVFGAVASLSPQKLRRVIGYVLVSDLGFVLMGMATNTRIGVAGAALHIAHRSLMALVMLAAASELERDDRGAVEAGQATPYMWAVLLVGALALVGVPPVGGFAASWAIFQAVSLSDWRLALALALTSGLCLIGLFSVLGRLRREYPRPWRRPRPAERFVMGLGAFAALWGLVPGPALSAIHAAVSQMPFLKPF